MIYTQYNKDINVSIAKEKGTKLLYKKLSTQLTIMINLLQFRKSGAAGYRTLVHTQTPILC